MLLQENIQPETILDAHLFEALLILGKVLGMSRSQASVFAALYANDEAATVEEIANLSNLSRSAVSLALRDLTQLGAVHEVMPIGERCRRYEGQPDLTETVTRMVHDRLKHPLAEFKQRVAATSVTSGRHAQAQQLLEQIETLSTHFNMKDRY